MHNVIAISGQAYSGCTHIGSLLARDLKYDFLSVGGLFKSIARGELSKPNSRHLKSFLELCSQRRVRIPTSRTIENYESALWNKRLGRNKELHKALDHYQKLVASRGNAIIEGSMSITTIPQASFKVWIDMPLDVAVQRYLALGTTHNSFYVRNLISQRRESDRERLKRVYRGESLLDQVDRADLILGIYGVVESEKVAKVISDSWNKLRQSNL